MCSKADIKAIAEANQTAKVIFETFANRKRFRRETDLNKLHQNLLNRGHNIIEDDYYVTFKKLELKGVGQLNMNKKTNSKRFKWNYNLKGIGQMAMGNEGKAESLDHKPMVKKTSTETIEVTLKIPVNVKPESLEYLFKTVESFKKVAA